MDEQGFNVGERVAFKNPQMEGGWSRGTISNARQDESLYQVKWDDGYEDEPDTFYGADELVREENVLA
jgi:uncharacterized protein YodC (DUF2158 family)